jgi:hypothetical protein
VPRPPRAYKYPVVSRATWIVIAVNLSFVLAFVVLLVVHYMIGLGRQPWADVAGTIIGFWLALPMPITSVAVAIYCFTIDRNTRWQRVRLLLSLVPLAAVCIFVVALLLNAFFVPHTPRAGRQPQTQDHGACREKASSVARIVGPVV